METKLRENFGKAIWCAQADLSMEIGRFRNAFKLTLIFVLINVETCTHSWNEFPVSRNDPDLVCGGRFRRVTWLNKFVTGKCIIFAW